MHAETSIIKAFGAEHIQRLTGLSARQLRDWDKAGFFAPSYASDDRRLPHSRVYSFQDLVGLRTLSVLSKKHRIPLSELKRVAAKLSKWSETPWSSLTLYVLKREVHFKNPVTGDVEGALSGQYATPMPLGDVMEDMRKAADRLRKRPAEKVGQIERHRYVMRNAWVVGGTRIPVSAIYSFSDAGFSPRQIIKEYPDLKLRDIQAALDRREELTLAA